MDQDFLCLGLEGKQAEKQRIDQKDGDGLQQAAGKPLVCPAQMNFFHRFAPFLAERFSSLSLTAAVFSMPAAIWKHLPMFEDRIPANGWFFPWNLPSWGKKDDFFRVKGLTKGIEFDIIAKRS